MGPLSQFERRGLILPPISAPGRACRRSNRPTSIAASTFPSLPVGLSNRNCGSDGARMAGGWRLPQSAGSRVVIFSNHKDHHGTPDCTARPRAADWRFPSGLCARREARSDLCRFRRSSDRSVPGCNIRARAFSQCAEAWSQAESSCGLSSASQTRVRKVGQSAVSSLQLTRRSVLVERADRRGFSHIMHMRLAKAAFVCRGYRTPMRSVIAANSNNASLLNRR